MTQTSLRKILNNLPPDQAQNIEALLTSDKAKQIATNVLIFAGVAGLMGLALTAPKTLQVFGPFLRKRYKRPLRSVEQKKKILQTFYYLKKSGQIKIQEKDGGLFAILTNKGRRRFNSITGEVHTIHKPSTWLGTWWLVAADIPTKTYKAMADAFRLKLRELHFYPLQRTLWVHPFDPRAELELIANRYGIGKFVTVMEIKRLDTQDEALMKDFFKKQNLL